MTLDTIYTKSDTVVVKEVGDECIIVPLSNNVADMDSVFTLNETGTFFWNLIDGQRTLKDIVDIVTSEYDVDKAVVEEDLATFIDEMKEFLVS